MTARFALLRLVLAWLLVNGLLLTPLWISAAVSEGSRAPWLSVEAALLVALLALVPTLGWRRALTVSVTFLLVLATLVAFASVVFQVSLGRPFNLFLDLYLVGAVYQLAVGNVGLPKTIGAFVLLTLALTIGPFVIARLLAPPDPQPERVSAPVWFGPGVALAVFALCLGLLQILAPSASFRTATPVLDLAQEQTEQLRATRAERAGFAAQLENSPESYADVPGLLGRLQGRDVLLTFIESYGMAALEDPDFSEIILPRLQDLSQRMTAAGLHLVSGSLTSPTVGGQSWYAHGTVLSGLWIENQLRYDLLMVDDGRETLVDDFRRAGYRTAAVMPAITMSWPEADRIGYDDVYTRPTIPYRGPPLYWVSMPDQFTLSFVEGTVRPAAGGEPLFVETALLSSHAPWTPVLPIVDWETIGDGSVFDPFRQEGHPPAELWSDVDVLRNDYARSLDYSLQAMIGFAERAVDERTLLIVMGDHQAAPWVTGATGAEVPVHVIARDPAILEPFLDWGFVPGGRPDRAAAAPRMDEFRDWFVRAYSGDAASHELHASKVEP
jgi:hypothetical protein